MTKTTKTTPLATRNRRSNAPDADTEAMIFQGCNITQLAKLFRMERRDITPKIMDIPPVGERGGYPIYAVHEVAPYLVKPLYDVETYLRRMNFKDLPKELSKEFWNGQRAKQEYDLRAGNLWPTEDVVCIWRSYQNAANESAADPRHIIAAGRAYRSAAQRGAVIGGFHTG